MSYAKKTWVNDETELSAQNFNYIENGIYNNQNIEIISVSAEAPTTFASGDKYYNTTNNKIYTATATEWKNGEEPIRGALYIVISEQVTYYYNGTTLVSVGGGTEDIYIQEEEPEDGKIWIDTSYVDGLGTEVVNSLAGNETSKAPSVSAVKEFVGSNTVPKGWCKLPNGLIIQWGNRYIGGLTLSHYTFEENFPKEFEDMCFTVISSLDKAGYNATSNSTNVGVVSYDKGKVNFEINRNSDDTGSINPTVRWIAIGK